MDGNESTKEEKAAEILRVLKTKKFVLLLDDIWERLDLLEMGVPHPDAQNKSKIVFTTRSQDVCRQMQAQKSIKVECLSSEAAWTLFQKKVGEETLKFIHIYRGLQRLLLKSAKVYLSLVTVGRAMVRKIPQIGTRLKEAAEISELKETEKMSLWDQNLEKFPETLMCPNLKTLFVRRCHQLTKFSSGFFQFMPLIKSFEFGRNDNLRASHSIPTLSNNNLRKLKEDKLVGIGLKWKDETIKDCFTPYFQVHEAEAYFAEESEIGNIDYDMQHSWVGAGSSSSGNSRGGAMLILRALIFHGAETAEKVGCTYDGCSILLFLDLRNWILWAAFGF
ncbi:putative disease resistance protein [Vitis vinifera]|uniref:Putative disease resistance protein n=1 Tax=Vitis vinifera TaxID=29760 RepID=A0A438DF64_VITVI|nr:putative disease resistance protein [Vitis vinifera]